MTCLIIFTSTKILCHAIINVIQIIYQKCFINLKFNLHPSYIMPFGDIIIPCMCKKGNGVDSNQAVLPTF